jgi:predicted RNA-binding Zn-ribbon protein involved in translation (DUF1610 family)
VTTAVAPPEQEQTKEVHVNTETFVCQNCGGIMKFDIKKQVFACAACKTEYDLQTLSDTVEENDFNLYLEREKATVPFEGMAVVACQQCGMEISFPGSQFSATCPMCGSTQVATVKQSAGIPPDGVIPFKIDKKDAQEKFRAWVKGRWFAPSDFKKRYAEGVLMGMFLPFWTYDANALSSYQGRGGNDRRKKDKDGKEKIVTDWYPVRGVVCASFDDIQICASNKEKNVEGVLPYGTTTNTKPFSAGYLSGYYAEVYKIKADACFEGAKRIMERTLRSLAESDIERTYDRAEVTSLSTKYSSVTYKHVLLPLWSSAFGYNGKTYNYAINGETGKVSGSRPYSAVKIALAVLGFVAAVAAWYLLAQN